MNLRAGEEVEVEQVHGSRREDGQPPPPPPPPDDDDDDDDGSARDEDARIAVDTAASQISSDSPHVVTTHDDDDDDDDDDDPPPPPKASISPSPDADVEPRPSLSSNLHLDELAVREETRKEPPNETPQITPDTTYTSKENEDSSAPAPTLIRASTPGQEGKVQGLVQVQEGHGQELGQDQVQVQGEDVKATVGRSIRSSIPAITKTLRSVSDNIAFSIRASSKIRSPPTYGYKSRRSLHMRSSELSVRSGATVLSLVAFSVMAANAEERQGAGSTFKMKFNDFDSYNYLVAVNAIVFTYFVGQLVFIARLNVKGDLLSYDKRLILYVADQVLAFLSFSASTAAATAAHLCRRGLPNIWPPACSTWKLSLFCTKADIAVAISFFASFCVIGSALFSGHHLSKLMEFI